MKLTKEHIQYIDKYLKQNGIKYWDLRIEMVDHLVIDIENNTTSENFNVAFTNSLIKTGWNKDLKTVNIQGWKSTNKLYQKKYFKEILKSIKTPKSIFLIAAFWFVYFSLSRNLEFEIFKKMSLLLFLIPVVFIAYKTIIIIFKKLGKSVNMDYGLFYFSFAFLLLQVVPNSIFKDSSVETQIIVWLIIMPIYFISTIAGFKVFKNALNKVENIKKALDIL